MKKLGQHFLKNAAVLQRIADALDLQKGDAVIEIGPGHGELTLPIARAAARAGASSVVAIEKDHSLIAPLGALAEKNGAGILSIMEADALKILPDTVARLGATPGGVKRYKIAGNIPYYITGKLLRVMSELAEKPERAVLLVQKEVAERISAAAPHMNRLAASVQFWADAAVIAHVPRRDFSPPPDVDSAVIVLKTKLVPAPIDPALYYRAVRAIFAQPRKTILNNVAAGMKADAPKSDALACLRSLGIKPEGRPQELTIFQAVELARSVPWG
ncbi:MAG TPA: 16S rRNA (adenine(1518)-N(6)/adenine(1519)-N(6))-dimethyltransferase RsmA [Candidatus Paceibacterota bacterium]|nr:16S rRNA (adenine(1518)-N(6)/adenine(1519)-N(6))-dimethyltransferase RsmA [Candidatus Paceibacterota bacterium]